MPFFKFSPSSSSLLFSNSLIELDEVDEAAEVTEPAMDRIRELLRFDDDADDNNNDGQDGADSAVPPEPFSPFAASIPSSAQKYGSGKEEEEREELVQFPLDQFVPSSSASSLAFSSVGGLNLLKHSNEFGDPFNLGGDEEEDDLLNWRSDGRHSDANNAMMVDDGFSATKGRKERR